MKKRKMWAVQLPKGELVWPFDQNHGMGGRLEAELANKNLEEGKGKVVRVIAFTSRPPSTVTYPKPRYINL